MTEVRWLCVPGGGWLHQNAFSQRVLCYLNACSCCPTDSLFNEDRHGTWQYWQRWAYFLRMTAGTAVARLSHRNSVHLSVTWVDQSKTV